jgi:hypothetical protein
MLYDKLTCFLWIFIFYEIDNNYRVGYVMQQIREDLAKLIPGFILQGYIHQLGISLQFQTKYVSFESALSSWL